MIHWVSKANKTRTKLLPNHKGQTWKLINGKRVWLDKVG